MEITTVITAQTIAGHPDGWYFIHINGIADTRIRPSYSPAVVLRRALRAYK